MKKLSSFIPILSIVLAIFTGNIALSASYSQELQEAYNFAYKNKITTQNSIDKADMNGGLTRIAMAKMLSQYAINILGKSPDTSKIPNFGDVDSKLDGDYNNGVTLAYQLGIMGVGIDKFRPYDSVTRAEFGTALSRVLYGDTYNQNGDNYYSKHLNALKNAGIMTKINTPFQGEIRGYVMLMLMRSKNDGNINIDSYPAIDSSEVICTKAGYYPVRFYYSDSHLDYIKRTSIIKRSCYPEDTKISEMESPAIQPTKPDDSNCSYKFKKWEGGKLYLGNEFDGRDIYPQFECIEKNNKEDNSSKKDNSEQTNIKSNNLAIRDNPIKLIAYRSKMYGRGIGDLITKDTGLIDGGRSITKMDKDITLQSVYLDYINIEGLDFDKIYQKAEVTIKINTNIDYDNIDTIVYSSECHGKHIGGGSISFSGSIKDRLSILEIDRNSHLVTIPINLGTVPEDSNKNFKNDRTLSFYIYLKESGPDFGNYISIEIVDIKLKPQDNISVSGSSVILDTNSYYPGIYSIPPYVRNGIGVVIMDKEDQEYDYGEDFYKNNKYFASNQWFDLGRIILSSENREINSNIKLKGVILSTDSNINLKQYVNDIKINNKSSWKIENNKIIIDYPDNDEHELSPKINFKKEFYNGEKEIHFFIAKTGDLKYEVNSSPLYFITKNSNNGPTIRIYSSKDISSNNSSSNSSNGDDSGLNNNSGNNDSSDDSSSNNSSGDDGSSSDSSNNSKNCVNIDVDDGNSFCFEITKGSGSKFNMSIAGTTNGVYGCSIKRGSSAGASVFNNCGTSGGEFTMLPSNGVSELLLKISYDGKEYTKRVSYDLTNGVFVEN